MSDFQVFYVEHGIKARKDSAGNEVIDRWTIASPVEPQHQRGKFTKPGQFLEIPTARAACTGGQYSAKTKADALAFAEKLRI